MIHTIRYGILCTENYKRTYFLDKTYGEPQKKLLLQPNKTYNTLKNN